MLHTLLFIPLALGGGNAGTRNAQFLAARSGAGAADEAESMTLEILDDPSSTDDFATNFSLADPTFKPTLPPIPVSVPPPPAYSIDADDVQIVTTADHERGELFGRYISQITARIERAWMRPRTPIGANLFTCRVEITQDHGVIQEVTLQRCNGDFRWQTSLVRGIQTASPLPAPPDPNVYQSRLILDFSSVEFAPGMNAGDFEPPAISTAPLN
jgi:TonB-like protein